MELKCALEILSDTKIFTKSRRLAIVARSKSENIPVFATTSLGDKPVELKGTKAWMNEILTELVQCMLDPKSEVSQSPSFSCSRNTTSRRLSSLVQTFHREKIIGLPRTRSCTR